MGRFDGPIPQIKGYKNIGKVFKYYKRHGKLFSGYLSIIVLNAIIGFAVPILLGYVIDNMSNGQTSQAIYYSVIIFCIGIIGHFLANVNVRFFKPLENNVKMDIKLDIMRRTLDLKMKNFEEQGNGLFITRLTSDLDITSSTFINISSKLVDFITKIGFIFYVYILNYMIGILLTIFVIMRYFIYKIRVKFYTKYKRQVYRRAETVNSTIGETIRGVKDIKTLNCEEQIIAKTKREQLDYMKLDNKEWYVGIFWCSFADFASSLCDLAFILLSAFLISKQSLSLAVFYTIYIYKGNIMNFAVAMGEIQRYLKEAEVCTYRIFELQNTSVYEVEEFGNKAIEDFKGGVKFENVAFSYNVESPVFDNLSFTIEPNQTVSFVGESGCGKSTIINLISKLYNIDKGKIYLDGVNLDDLSKEFIRTNVSVVTQLPYIFNMSIRDNFLLVKPNTTDDEIYEVCKKVGLTQFIKKLPNGLDTVVGEGGSKASGGQRQRLSIARALIEDSKIIVFDESTSALDNNSQDIIMKTIDKLKNQKTIIIIAHRLSTIENCDKLFFLKDGKIAGEGTHKQLMRENKDYKELYQKELIEKQDNE